MPGASNGGDAVFSHGSGDAGTDAAPDLRIGKYDHGHRVAAGEIVIYTLTYANVGTREASGVRLVDTVPMNTVFVPAASTPGWACLPDGNAASICTLSIGDLPVGGAGQTSFGLRAAAAWPHGATEITNTACIEDDGSNGPDLNPQYNCDDDVTPVDAVLDLMIIKDDSDAVADRNGIVAYTLYFENIGSNEATGVLISDTVPPYTTFSPTDSSPGWACLPNTSAGSVCTLTLGVVSAGGSGTATMGFRVDGAAPPEVTQIQNTACIQDDGVHGPDVNPGDNCEGESTSLRPPTPTPKPSKTCLPLVLRSPPPSPGSTRIPVPGLAHPNAIAVNERSGRVFVSSRDNDAVYVVSNSTLSSEMRIDVCDEPFGIAANSRTNKVYVSCFASNDMAVIDGGSLVVLTLVNLGPQPTYVDVNETTNRVYAVTHGNNGLVEILGNSDSPGRIAGLGLGAFALAVNENLNRIYASSRDAGIVATIDGQTMSEIAGQRVVLADRSVPYALGFNPVSNRLYLTHTDQGLVTQLSVYAASTTGLTSLTTLTIPDGGRDTTGSLGVNTATDHIFVPNAASDSISVIDGARIRRLALVTPFPDPFGIAADAALNRVYVGARSSDELWAVPDIY